MDTSVQVSCSSFKATHNEEEAITHKERNAFRLSCIERKSEEMFPKKNSHTKLNNEGNARFENDK